MLTQKPVSFALLLIVLTTLLSSCFKDIDTAPLPLPEVEEYFIVQHNIKKNQSFFRFYENTVLEVDSCRPSKWDLAFESAGEGSRVLLGWGTFSTAVPSGKFEFSEISQDFVISMIDTATGWVFDDPSFVNNYDSLALTNHWENSEIWIQNRGVTDDNYYLIQYVSANETSYTFRYASARSLQDVNEATIYRSGGLNYVYYSFESHSKVSVEPNTLEWDILFSPYRGWWETDDPGIYSPFNMSGILINNESGVRVARVFDPEVSFQELDSLSILEYDFTDWKGVIGADWKVLGDQNSGNIFSVDPHKKYLMEKFNHSTGDLMYFKLQIIDYKQGGEDHHPTVEFKYLGSLN